MTNRAAITPFASCIGPKIFNFRKYRSELRGSLVLPALLSLAHGGVAFAATAPALGTNAPFGLVSSSFTNTAAGTTIQGNVCYTSGPAVTPSIFGTVTVPCDPANGTDQNAAVANLNGQVCTPIAGALDAVVIGGGTPGTIPPGCYEMTGAMNITTGTTVTLNGAGVYVFRTSAGGALTTGANSNVVMSGAGACASDVFWVPTGAATLGANTSMVGTILAAPGITMGNLATLVGRALAFGGTVTTAGSTVTAPTCTPFAGNINANPVPTLAPILPSTAIPTLSQWATILLAGLMALGGFIAMRRKA